MEMNVASCSSPSCKNFWTSLSFWQPPPCIPASRARNAKTLVFIWLKTSFTCCAWWTSGNGHGASHAGHTNFVVVIWWWKLSIFTWKTAGAIDRDVATRTSWTIFGPRIIFKFSWLARDTRLPLWILLTAIVDLCVSVQALSWWTAAMFAAFPVEWFWARATAAARCGNCFGTRGRLLGSGIHIIFANTWQGSMKPIKCRLNLITLVTFNIAGGIFVCGDVAVCRCFVKHFGSWGGFKIGQAGVLKSGAPYHYDFLLEKGRISGPPIWKR